jgi:subfamily B ATP-binding cassette protein MsbA
MPSANKPKPDTALKTARRLVGYAFAYKIRVIWALICIAIVAVLDTVSFTVLLPIIQMIFKMDVESPDKFKFFLDYLYTVINPLLDKSPMLCLIIIALIYAGATLVKGAFSYIQMYFMYWMGYRIALDLQTEMFSKMSRYHMGYFAKHKTGSLISYFTVDIRVISIALFNIMGKIILDPFKVLLSYLLLLYINWQLTLMYSIIAPVIFLVIRFLAKKNRRAGRQAQDFTADLNALVQEHFSHIRLVQGYEMYDHQSRRFYKEAFRVFRASMSMMKALAASSPINELLGVIGACGVLILGGYFVIIQQSMEADMFVSYIFLLVTLFQPIKRIERSIQDVQIGLASAERVFEALDQNAVLPLPDQPKTISSFEKEIHFNQVNFAYDANEPVLHDINLHVNKGEVIAFVGPSGAGKTTIVNLIPRFFDPISGSVTIDGYNLRELDLTSLRKHIALVTQDVMIMADTIRANITCGFDHYTMEEIQAAANAANADEFINQLPHQYETVIGERGTGLSGGQRQRLALARAFLRNSPIIILDEATSSLDSRSEQHIKNSIDKLMQGRTVFVIAHRLSTILHADVIVVMDQGRIVDQGKHSELLERCPLYQKLYHIQMSSDQIQTPQTDTGS